MTELKDYVCRDFKPFKSSDTIDKVQDFFADTEYTHFPVLEDDLYIGSIGAEDADTFDTEKPVSHYRYALEGFYARSGMVLLDVLEVFSRNHSNLVPVLDENNRYTGYYESAQVISLFQETPFLKELGGIIIVEKAISDYSMGQVVQIVESNNGKILGCFVSATHGDQIQVTVKVAIGGVNDIIQTFRRYGYEIISLHQEDNYLNSLKERSDYLDKYLNI